MKTRNGFVSNSSSSSFVLIGKKIDKEYVDDYDEVVYVGNDDGCDGLNVFGLSPEDKVMIKTMELSHWQNLYASFFFSSGEGTMTSTEVKKLAEFLSNSREDEVCYLAEECDQNGSMDYLREQDEEEEDEDEE
jgi:hypothetical protein